MKLITSIFLLLSVISTAGCRDGKSGFQASGGIEINGRHAYYSTNHSTIKHVVIFDLDWINASQHASMGNVGLNFQLKDGRGFQFNSDESRGLFKINDIAYPAKKGHVFLVKSVANGFEVQQLPIKFDEAAAALQTESVNMYVETLLKDAAKRNTDLKSFLILP